MTESQRDRLIEDTNRFARETHGAIFGDPPGDPHRPGLLVRVDRLEQERERDDSSDDTEPRNHRRSGMTFGGTLLGVAAVISAIAAFVGAVVHGSSASPAEEPRTIPEAVASPGETP